ncbi:histidine phosphatase family protein [Streptomyces sp. NPDC059881]|uniref:histidine phosphatase family protein n=1 Tax=Streptomyces sp. NPDC059881 TaxID=3346986 RepID=UPI0036602771
MMVRLTFLCTTTGDTSRDTVLGDSPATERALRAARAAGAALPPRAPAVRAPSIRCSETADALGLGSRPEPALRDCDYGKWCGLTVEEVAATDPHGLSDWLTDPDATPHGGESVREFCRRVARWLGSVPPGSGHTWVVTEPAVVRASLVHALAAPARAFWHYDVPALSAVTLTSRGGRWNVRFD